jgi:hypothetical protein
MSGGMPFGKFFWSDYSSDPALKICSFAAQGLWMRMLCIAAEHDPVGYVAVNGEGLDAESIAALSGGRIEQVEELLAELERRGVFSRDRRGWIYSRRMIRDAKKARKARENGSKGGNPRLSKETENQPSDNGEDKPHIPEARSQSLEKKEEDGGADAPNGKYVFEGDVIRLTKRHFDQWAEDYHTIRDLRAELRTLDAWWYEQPAEKREKWFVPSMKMLNKKHQENLEAIETYDPDRITV